MFLYRVQQSYEFKSFMVPGLPLYEARFIKKGLHIRYVFYFSNIFVALFIESVPPCPPPFPKVLFCEQAVAIFCIEDCSKDIPFINILSKPTKPHWF